MTGGPGAALHGGTRSTDVLNGFAPPVPEALARRAADRDPAGPVAEPRRSASVVLLRDAAPGAADGGVEVYLLHRHARMPFAPSVAVFPGGGLDAADEQDADPLVACALRETAEETTVRLDAGALVRWARWVTPEPEPRRYDTTFFLARVPEGQEPADVSGETERAGWTGAVEALAARERGALVLMPPTWSILLELAAAPDVATLLRAGADRVVRTVLPRVVPDGAGSRFDYTVLR